MKRSLVVAFTVIVALAMCAGVSRSEEEAAGALKVHGIFSSNMVLQRDKPIKVWGWAKPGATLSVSLGEETGETVAAADGGLWEVTFPAREASAVEQALAVSSGSEKILMTNIVVGDVWVMNGQSNMAYEMRKTQEKDIEGIQAHLPLLREFRIKPNEQAELATDLPKSVIGEGWRVSTPKQALYFSAIGYYFASRLQRALQIPIGIIDNARGGAAIESLVPAHKFADDPLAAAYKAYIEKRQAEFDPEAVVEAQWQRALERAKKKGLPKEKWPKKGSVDSLRSWDIPGRSPSDAAACYNGMFGVFKGLNIKGVLFHQGFNNAMGPNCRPKRYRVLMKLMVEGWREDFNDPQLPVGIIGFCAGGIPQTDDNFELWSGGGAAYIREAQRLGLADVGDPENTAFLPAYDVQVVGLHPGKKQAHGIRAARWALNRVYKQTVKWDTASLVSATRDGDVMVLTFDKKVMPDDMSLIPEGFSIADESGTFYKAYARFQLKKDSGIWNTANKSFDTTKLYVWSPLVKEPAAVRYGWSSSPIGNLKVDGKPWQPLPSFRTDEWDFPESDDPAVSMHDKAKSREMAAERAERLDFRKKEEAKVAPSTVARLKVMGRDVEGE